MARLLLGSRVAVSFGNVKRSLSSRNPSRVMGIGCDCDMKHLRSERAPRRSRPKYGVPYQQSSFRGKLPNSESDIGSNLLMTDLRRHACVFFPSTSSISGWQDRFCGKDEGLGLTIEPQHPCERVDYDMMNVTNGVR